MLINGPEVGRVCPYAAQQCGLEAGCVMFDSVPFGADQLDLEARARSCTAAGAFLFAGEVRFGMFDRTAHNDADRFAAHNRRISALRRRLDLAQRPTEDEYRPRPTAPPRRR